MQTQTTNTTATVMNLQEAAAFLRLSGRTVYMKAVAGIIPCHQVEGVRKLLFFRDELETYLRGKIVKEKGVA